MIIEDLKEIKSISGWLYRNPLRGLIFVLFFMCLVLGLSLYNETKRANNCVDERTKDYEHINDVLYRIIEKQNTLKVKIDSTTQRVDTVLRNTQKTIKAIKKR